MMKHGRAPCPAEKYRILSALKGKSLKKLEYFVVKLNVDHRKTYNLVFFSKFDFP